MIAGRIEVQANSYRTKTSFSEYRECVTISRSLRVSAWKVFFFDSPMTFSSSSPEVDSVAKDRIELKAMLTDFCPAGTTVDRSAVE